MLQFVVTNILMLSVGTILFLVVRSLPRIDDATDKRDSLLDRWAASEIPEKIDSLFNRFFAKFLRRVKVLLLKIDYFLTQRLKGIKVEEEKSNFTKSDFAEIKDKQGEKK